MSIIYIFIVIIAIEKGEDLSLATRESGLQMPNNEYTRFPVVPQVSFGTGATVHADAAEEEEEEEEEVRAASLQHLRMQTLATLSKSLFFFEILQRRAAAVLSGISQNI